MSAAALLVIILIGAAAMASFAFACGRIASRAGWNYARFFLLGLFLGPVGLLLTWAAHRRGPEHLRYSFVHYPAPPGGAEKERD